MKGNIFNIQHFSTQDGPGIRTTVFLKGCPLHCAWCHNPESQRCTPDLFYHEELCIHCGGCAAACPQSLHTFDGDTHRFDRHGCMACGRCAAVCPSEALQLCGQTVEHDAVIAAVERDRPFYKNSGGGLTISGGEPLMQPAFTLALAKRAQENHIGVCIETCGFGEYAHLASLIPYTDWFLFDCKLLDPDRHTRYTGVSNVPILHNLERLSEDGARIILRCPIIPDINLQTSHFDAIAALANRISGVEEIHIEPYHPLGLDKAKQLGTTQGYPHTKSLTHEELVPYVTRLRADTPKPIRVL